MTIPATTRRILLAAVPGGLPTTSDFQIEDIVTPTCPAEGILVRTAWISVDPYLRGRIAGKRTYVDPIPVGSVMVSSAIGEVVESRGSSYAVGDYVTGMWGWQDYAAPLASTVRRIDPADGPVQASLGILGTTGLTAYFGLLELCAPKAGETVLVSGAAGAVGSVVGQLAKIAGCRVVGVAGSAEKVEYIKSLGFDDAMDYKVDWPYDETLARLCPQGIDCYFDNVGGALTDAVYPLMNSRGRVSICGQISQYNDRSKDTGPRPYTEILTKQLRVEGFIISRWADRWAEGRSQMGAWLKEGRLRYQETITDGLENAPLAFIGLFHGENTGKALVRL